MALKKIFRFNITEFEFRKIISETVRQTILEVNLNKVQDDDELWKKEFVADLLGVKPETMNKYNWQRLLPYIKSGKTCLYKKSDVIAYLMKNRMKARDEILRGVNNLKKPVV